MGCGRFLFEAITEDGELPSASETSDSRDDGGESDQREGCVVGDAGGAENVHQGSCLWHPSLPSSRAMPSPPSVPWNLGPFSLPFRPFPPTARLPAVCLTPNLALSAWPDVNPPKDYCAIFI